MYLSTLGTFVSNDLIFLCCILNLELLTLDAVFIYDRKMSVSYPTKMILAFRSGECCAYPNCTTLLTANAPAEGDPIIVGEAAHIAGEQKTAARYDPLMSNDARNHYNNLIFLCPTHHTQIDKQPAHFSVEWLHQRKALHEEKVREAVHSAFAQIGFAELKIATDWVTQYGTSKSSLDYTLLPPDEKIQKNGLINESRLTITMGLSVAKLVGNFVQQMTQIDTEYPEKLTSGFLEEYHRLYREGHRGDVLFDLMCIFAQQGLIGQSKRSAGLAVLVYLFEKCEIFKK